MNIFRRTILVIFLLSFFFYRANSQASHCGPTTPTFTVNLTGFPNGTYTSPPVVRADTCCGSSAPDRCVQFIVTLDPAAVGLIFTVCNGAVPPGALYYQVNCGPPHAVGTGICITPPYPDTITFCKPGNNQNQYCIQSIAPPSVVGLTKNCAALMWTYGFEDSTIVWTSVFPGPPGAYNGYLSCVSGCDSTWVTPQTGYPPYIDYQVCGTVTNGCNKNFCDTVRVIFPPPLTTTLSATPVSCYGGNNGTATAASGGGIIPYSYSWLPAGGSNSTASGLSAGTYTCTVTDSAGCKVNATVTVIQPPQLTATYSTTAATCSQSNGSGTAIPSGGTPSYTYQWLNGQTTATATGLAPGVYQVTIGDANGCTLTMSIPISNVLPIVTVNSTSVTCYGGSTGSATSNASGGVPPYSYQWSNGQTTSTATGLSAGTYTIATSSSGCVHYDLVTIPQPAALTGTITAQINVACNGGNTGSVAINYSGGTPGYLYSWAPSGGNSSSATGLAAGNYTLTVTDANGCPVSNTVAITQPPLLSSVSPSQTNVSCNGGNNGSADVIVTGGTPNYTYSWTPSGGNSPAASGLSAGNYTCTTNDANGCVVTNTFAITQPPALVPAIAGATTVCFGKNITLSGSSSGGTPGYTYSWNPAGVTASAIVVSPSASTTYSLLVTDASGCSMGAQAMAGIYPKPSALFTVPNSCLNNSTGFSDSSFGSIAWAWNFGEPASGSNNISSIQNPSHVYGSAGTFLVTLIVASLNGCSDTVSHMLTINPIPSVSFTSNTVCFGNTTTFNNASVISGGVVTGWNWNFADPNSGVNNISLSQSPTHIFTAAGTFNVILSATSDSGCQNSIQIPVVVYPIPTPSFTSTHACSNSAVSFNDASANAVQWQWNFGNAGATSTLQNPNYTYPSPGNYTVTLIVASLGGCKDTVSLPITVDTSPVPDFSPDTVCVGFATAFTDLSTASPGNVTNWLWNFGDSSAADTVQNPTHIYTIAGIFSVTLAVTSSNGCVSLAIKPVKVYPQPIAEFSLPASCINLGDEAEFTDLSKSGIISWQWFFSDSGISAMQNPAHMFTDTGNYVITLIVQDNHGCMDTVQHDLCIREWTFYIPNAFTPDHNGKNDVFFGMGIGITQYQMWIFDRWGNLIFNCQVDDLPQALPCQWNGSVTDGGIDLNGQSGKKVQEDVYVWKVHLTNVLLDEHTYVGSVTVVR